MIVMRKIKIASPIYNMKLTPQWYNGENAAKGLRCRACQNQEFVMVNSKKCYICNKRKDKNGDVYVIKLNYSACDEFFERKVEWN